MYVRTVDNSVAFLAEPTLSSVYLLPPTSAVEHLVLGHVCPLVQLPGLVHFVIVVPKTTSALGKIATIWTISAKFKCAFF